MTRLDEETHIRVHEGTIHTDSGTVWQHKLLMALELLDEAEDIVL